MRFYALAALSGAVMISALLWAFGLVDGRLCGLLVLGLVALFLGLVR